MRIHTSCICITSNIVLIPTSVLSNTIADAELGRQNRQQGPQVFGWQLCSDRGRVSAACNLGVDRLRGGCGYQLGVTIHCSCLLLFVVVVNAVICLCVCHRLPFFVRFYQLVAVHISLLFVVCCACREQPTCASTKRTPHATTPDRTPEWRPTGRTDTAKIFLSITLECALMSWV